MDFPIDNQARKRKKYLKWIIELCVIPSKRLRASRKTHAKRLTLKY